MLMRSLFICLLGLGFVAFAQAKDLEICEQGIPVTTDSLSHPVIGRGGMVAAQEHLAAQVGADILARGGNAIDAAVATGFAMAVTHPQAGNLGGGGFMLVSLEGEDAVIAIDFRETAPASAHRDMYLNADGDVDTQRGRFSHLSAGVPGTVMGLLEALETYGTMNRREVIGPAIRLADRGIAMAQGQAQSFEDYRERLSQDPSSKAYFLAHGAGYKRGDRFVQKDLAATLRRIRDKGADDFYKGRTAELIVAEMEAQGGAITHADLENYTVVTRKAIKGHYKNHDVYSMPPPSSGGVHVIQMLNILSGYDLQSDGHNSAAYIHKVAESMRRAFADRSKYLGDPDFFDVPTDAITDMSYAEHLRASIDLQAASPSATVAPASQLPHESHETTHYSVIDAKGNAVAVTYTLNFSYGSGMSVDGAGFLLNNEMDDFSAKPGSPNGYGLIGGEANKIEPGKRPLSSMTPVIVKKDGVPVLVTGSPGGSTIITAVLQMVLNVLEWEMNLADATQAARIHHQWLPDVLRLEPSISPDTEARLQAMGHVTSRETLYGTTLGRVNSVGARCQVQLGMADLRDPKAAAIGVD